MTEILKDSTSHSPFFELVDSTTGLPKTAIVYTDVTASYCRSRGARVAITPATLASASAAYSSGGFILVDDANQPGVYRFDVPNAAFATGVEEVVVTVKATGCRTVSRSFTLTDISMQTAKVPATIATGDIADIDATRAAKIDNLDATISSRGTSTLTQTQVTGGAYALNSSSFAFNSAMDFTTAQKAATLARVTLVDTTTTNTDMRGTDNAALAATALSTAVWTNGIAARIDENVSAAKTLTSAYDPAKTAATQTSVTDISNRLPAALTGDGNLKADALKVNGQTPQTIPTLAHFSVG